MIWYILYPFRGTTEPPRLSPVHPIRRAFQAHGIATAQHWRTCLFLTIFVSVVLCYSAVFQPDSPAATGLRNLPQHVWTSTNEVSDDRPVDVDVHQVWVHGDYMKAIDHSILREALRVQEALIGRGFDEIDDTAQTTDHLPLPDGHGCPIPSEHGRRWGMHSPLMYWNCSLKELEEDPSLLATINARSNLQTSLNITLRPSTVFAGKSFTKKKLKAADALVITLFDQANSSLGAIWNERSRLLSEELSSDWSLFPKDGLIWRNRLYEFHFKPMTLIDDLFLAASYVVTAAYVIWRMMKLRAVKSWFGLLITICVKMTVCVIGSFTVCAYLGINLARIPRPWFPGVVFCFAFGNIFRLINVVLETPPEMPPVQRIGNALGEVGHLSLAVAGQNLVLIYLCSRVVTPWVADFCVFAAVTLVLDLVFHLTFFLAVLSVDVQRMELQDSLGRIEDSQSSKHGRQERQSWFGALLRNKWPSSTRWASSAAILSIIVAVNWHFFDSETRQLSVRETVDKLVKRHAKRTPTTVWTSPPINQARTPAEWLQLQDHNTARELIGAIKPNAHSFIARIYDPLLVVLRDANGRDKSQKITRPLPESIRHFGQEHAFPAALIVVFLIAAVTLLMNYLLWTGIPEATSEEEEVERNFSVKTLPMPQVLDIARLTSCPKGHLVSISLDRSTSLWLYEPGRGYMNTVLQTASMNPKLWPIVACALDDGGKFLALCTDEGQIGIFSLATGRFFLFLAIELRGQVPILFSFASIHPTQPDRLSLVIVTPDGHLTEFDTKNRSPETKYVHSSAISAATLYSPTKDYMNLLFVCKFGKVHIMSLNEGSQWTPDVVAGLDPGPPPDSNPSKIRLVYGVPSLGLIFALRSEEAEIFDFSSRALIYNLPIGHVKPQTFRVMHSSRKLCHCGGPAVHTLCIAYNELDTNHMIMQTFTLDDDSASQVCLGKPSETEAHNCQGLGSATEAVHCVEPAGVWESTNVLSIVGVRRCSLSLTPSSAASGVDSGFFASAPGSALKLRATKQGRTRSVSSLNTVFNDKHPPASPTDPDNWEAWTLSSNGEFRSRPLETDDPSEDSDQMTLNEQLFVASAGPITRLGKRSVAVGFGNVVKVVTLGKESFGGLIGGDGQAFDPTLGTHKSRLRRTGGRKTQ
ncbi:hypothetical protein CC78DRAFT_112485 [Lojkania enalia]|uniref:Sterol regulatory element-binding protein cleavage-activating protein n=1 Tax=Lojkania enalia TaxID=147567 RepID=A0A9P4KE58_9PLEO|nr:hypothetical protein CC78DRAFT_112485 [Didymosphaeria enalia]